jgi:RNA polymerase sigma factor (TIGR02999 family)
MSDVTQILAQIESGDPRAAEQLLPLVYNELRRLAAARLAQEKPGQTLQATALVHEAYVRLVDVEKAQLWDSRGHFFASAAEAMRRILVDRARHKTAKKRGGTRTLADLREGDAIFAADSDDILLLDDALTKLATEDSGAADVAKLRLFAGLSVAEAASSLGVSRTTAFRRWTYAQAWLTAQMREQDDG